jgi:sugar O-acyltransferase (sialic acid O-acetyltransferase NeuD family)
MNDKPVILLGGGGHACVLVDVLRLLKKNILGFVGPQHAAIKNCPDIPYLGDEQVLHQSKVQEFNLINAVGSISAEKNTLRQALFDRFKQAGFEFATVIHPSAVIASSVKLGEGVQVMAGVVLQPNVIVHENTIINTSVSLDHDCYIGKHVHIAPGASMSGHVTIGDNAFIGVGAIIIQNVHIHANSMIRAGATVVRSTVIRENQ